MSVKAGKYVEYEGTSNWNDRPLGIMKQAIIEKSKRSGLIGPVGKL